MHSHETGTGARPIAGLLQAEHRGARKLDMLSLIEASDEHFVWMLEGSEACPLHGLTQPPGGVAEPPVLELLRRIASDLTEHHGFGHWLVVVDDEVVGSCGYMRRPTSDGAVEIGYGIAPARRGLGLATLAVAALVERIAKDPIVRRIIAETSADNIASQRVLEHNQFVLDGNRHDPDDGDMLTWRRDITTPTHPNLSSPADE